MLPFYSPGMAVVAFQYPHRVTYADCTVGNHVYYGRYLDMLEAARGDFLRELGATFLQWQERDVVFPVIECRMRYKTPARYDDVLTVEIWPTAIEGVRLGFGGRIVNQAGAVVLVAETIHACTSVDGKPKRLPEALIERLRPYCRAIGDGG